MGQPFPSNPAPCPGSGLTPLPTAQGPACPSCLAVFPRTVLIQPDGPLPGHLLPVDPSPSATPAAPALPVRLEERIASILAWFDFERVHRLLKHDRDLDKEPDDSDEVKDMTPSVFQLKSAALQKLRRAAAQGPGHELTDEERHEDYTCLEARLDQQGQLRLLFVPEQLGEDRALGYMCEEEPRS